MASSLHPCRVLLTAAVVCSEEPDAVKVAGIRFCAVGHDQFQLGATIHPGRWQPTPCEGLLLQLCDKALIDFPWILVEF